MGANLEFHCGHLMVGVLATAAGRDSTTAFPFSMTGLDGDDLPGKLQLLSLHPISEWNRNKSINWKMGSPRPKREGRPRFPRGICFALGTAAEKNY